MKRSELLELIAGGENSGVEFKRDDLRPEQLAREVVALANFQGGRVLLGVEDDGSITGIQRDHLERWVMDSVFGRVVHPMILPFYEEVPIDDVRRVAVITVRKVPPNPMSCGIAAGKIFTYGSAVRLGWPRASSKRGFSLPVGWSYCRFPAVALAI